ncbi:MAG: hypothetical protein J6I73_04240 [Treponema sp.]|nr:hypothetical protein [Treponema sp.]
MNNNSKIFLVLAACAAVVVFAACKQNAPEWPVEYTDAATVGIASVTNYFRFEEDGTFLTGTRTSAAGQTIEVKGFSGTYTGNPKADGEVKITYSSGTSTLTISGGKFTFAGKEYSR